MHGPHPLSSDSGFSEPREADLPLRSDPIPERAGPSKHVVHVITRLLQGGAEENTVSTCLYQARQGSRVTLLHGPDPHPAWTSRLKGQVSLIAVPSMAQSLNPLRDAKAVWELRNLLRSLRADVVHTHQSKAGILGRLAAALARVPLIVHTVHIAPFVNVSGPRRWFYAAAERICQRYTHLFIAVSHGMRDAFLGEGIGRKKAFEVVHSGMPLAKFDSARMPADWRDRIQGWDGPERPKFILMLAAFEPRKRHYDFLKEIAPQLRARSNLCLLLAGEGSDQKRCRDLVRSLDLTAQVRFLGHDPKPEELIALADICVLTSEREGLPRSAVQYVAGGKPVILTRLPGIEELIVDGVNGIITDPEDLSDTVEQAMKLLDDGVQLARLASGARATDVSQWREEAMGERIEAAYQRATATGMPVFEGSASTPVRAIEFFGLPGAGKTALARSAVALLREEGHRVSFSEDLMGDRLGLWRRSARRLGMVATSLPRHFPTALHCARLLDIARKRPMDLIKSLWNFYSVLAISLRQAHKRDELLVLDQGLVQAVWSARVYGPGTGRNNIAPILNACGGIERTLFVYVRTSTDIARSRLERRKAKTSRMQRANRVGDSALWDRGAQMAADLSQCIEQELGRRSLQSHLVRVNSSPETDPTETAKVIVAHLARVEAALRDGM